MSDLKNQAKALKGNKLNINLDMRKYGMFIILIIITIFFQLQTDGVLLAPMNVSKLIMQNGYILILAIGMLPVILTGNVDLSVGSTVAIVSAVTGTLLVGETNIPVFLGILIGLIVGLVIGAWNGYWIAFFNIPAFIVTLSSMLIFRGLTIVITKGKTLGPYPDSYQYIAQAYIPDIPGTEDIHLSTLLIGLICIILYLLSSIRKRKQQVKYGFKISNKSSYIAILVLVSIVFTIAAYWLTKFNGMPFILIILGILVIVFSFITQRTVIGRHIYALGGNEKAATLSGVKTKWVKFSTYANMGVFAAFSGIVYSARINSANPTAGEGFELDAIAACYIGGASASGGVGTIGGAVIGGLVMGVLNNGMSIMGIGVDWQKTIKGIVLLAAVVLDQINQKRKQ